MITNKMIKDLMISATTGLVMFILSFTAGWFLCDDMTSMLMMTLPFMIIMITSLCLATILEQVMEKQEQERMAKKRAKVTRIRRRASVEYYNVLRKAS